MYVLQTHSRRAQCFDSIDPVTYKFLSCLSLSVMLAAHRLEIHMSRLDLPLICKNCQQIFPDKTYSVITHIS